MSATPDPLKDWLVAAWRDTVGDTTDARGDRTGDGRMTCVSRFVPFSPLTATFAAAAFSSPTLIASVAGNASVVEALTGLHDYRWPLAVVTAPLIALDISRHLTHQWSQMLDAMVQQSTGHIPTKISISRPTTGRSIRGARIKLSRGAVIRPKQFEALSCAVESAFGTSETSAVTVRHDAHRDRLVITRTPITPDTRSERQKVLQDALDGATIFKSPKVSVDTIDEDGIETGYRIAFAKSMNAGAPGFQAKVDEALASLAGPHESGRNWTCDWYPNKGYLVMRLVTAMPERVDHPLELVDENLRHLPYATGAADRIMFWDVSTSSNKPHCLIVGPTGGGKTSVIRTLLTEAARRGVPFVGVDPKMIELDGLEGYPGCGAIIYDALRAAMFVRALHTEMMARNAYIHQMKIEGSQLPLMIAVLDEFFILSGKWQRLAKTGDDETKTLLKELDPLGAWADLAVLARSAGIRLLLGVQRPDASLFGGASGNARDNFGTRISLGNLSQDGALMMWGDSTVGREVDTSVKGRGIALGDDGSPVDAQMWWTPNVDKHPNKWNQLSESEKSTIDGLMPAEAPQFTCYSPELADFIESERALARRARNHGSVPEPIVLGGTSTGGVGTVSMAKAGAEAAPEPESADEDFADVIPASSVTAGQTVLIDDEDGDLVPVTVDAVDVRRGNRGEVIETVLTIGAGRVTTRIAFDANGVVVLPEPDLVGHSA
ncbi:FtsK/SpoIIIE domain-containing protein [Rhodococcus sp. B50]|uniref:FtsK/SpoIIIE domain-containing protein n=1 Tax=Rhodococcus sp. B50 TaxID=2682847 RepID=UPI001BD2EEA3|nr:FtsK/SpoIIIE domain-containing protein [Rhodococcus sp. B50]MBS9375945.1 DNA translocase SpoIIIE [Rhodococcus sp. B50]